MRKKPAGRKRLKKVRKLRKVKFIPAGYHSVTPYLACQDAARAIDFYKRAFGAIEVMRDRAGSLQDPFGHVWHIATHKEDLSVAQLRKRAEKAMKEMGGSA